MSNYHYALKTLAREDFLARKKYLERLAKRLEGRISKAPPGSLLVNQKKRTEATGFYHVLPKTRERVYLTREKRELVRALAQKEYDRKALKAIQMELDALETILAYCEQPKLEDVFEKCHVAKRPYIRPIVETDEVFRQKWLEQKYYRNEYAPEQKRFPTERGDSVRSKSEGQQADYLYYHNYAYLYEKRLELKDGGRTVYRYPDFTILDPVTRKEVYFEHFGMADEEGYLVKNAEKLRLYMENGYVIGRDVIFTLETREHPFTIDQFARLLEARFGTP